MIRTRQLGNSYALAATAAASSSSRRGLAAAAAAAQPSLDLEFPGVPALKPVTSREKPTTKITTLSNGMRVASEETFQQCSTLGLFVGAGSRMETDANNGVCHFQEHMAFKSTSKRSSLRIARDIEDMGGVVAAHAAREYMVYTADVLRPHAPEVVKLLAEAIRNPLFAPWDIEEERKALLVDIEDFKKDASMVVTELLHSAAYDEGSPLGRSLIMPPRNLHKIGADELKELNKTYFVPSNMVLVGAGVNHEELVKLCEAEFGSMKAAPKPAVKACTYRGGDARVRGDAPTTHMAMGFNVEKGWNAENPLTICVAHMLLGGGSSFSAGGPGKGLYSRLYTRVLNQYAFAECATACNSMYNDNGMFGIYATCPPANAENMCKVMTAELLDLASKTPSEEEISRAKNQLKSSIVMNLESRSTLFEDIGRQILTFGKRDDPSTILARIDAISPSQVQQAVATSLKSPLSFAAFGDVSNIPSYKDLDQQFR